MVKELEATVRVAESLSVGNGGWVRYQSQVLPDPVFLRFEDHDGRLVPVDLFLPSERVTAATLRKVPLGRIEAWANEDPLVRYGLTLPHVDLRTAASHFVTTFGHTATHWVAEMLHSQLPGWEGERPKRLPLAKPLGTVTYVFPSALIDVTPAEGRDKGDAFYRRVAEVYREQSSLVRAPVGAMADANGVPVSTAYRWVKEARARGFLPPGSPGRTG